MNAKKTSTTPAIKIPVSLAEVETSERDRPPHTPPLTEENATTPYAVQALAEAQNGNLDKLVFLAGSDWRHNEDVKKAIALFDEAAYSSEPHWLTEAVYSLALREQTADTLFLQMEILSICPFFHFKILSRISESNAEINKIINQVAKSAITNLKEIKEGWHRGSAKTNQRHQVLREFFIANAIPLAEKDTTCRYHDLILGCKGLLATKCHELNLSVPNDMVLRKWLKNAAKEGRLPISPDASKPGRPAR